MMFQAGYAKMYSNYSKQYHPFLVRNGRRRYAGKGRVHFKTATRAMQYALRWAKRAESFLQVREVEPSQKGTGTM